MINFHQTLNIKLKLYKFCKFLFFIAKYTIVNENVGFSKMLCTFLPMFKKYIIFLEGK